MVAKEKLRKATAKDFGDKREVSMSILGEVGAGTMLGGGQAPIGSVPIPGGLRWPDDVFGVRVAGERMSAARLMGEATGLRPGDVAVMRWRAHQEPHSGDIVAANLPGEGTVLQRYREHGGRRWLESEPTQPGREPIELPGEESTPDIIQAVLVDRLPGGEAGPAHAPLSFSRGPGDSERVVCDLRITAALVVVGDNNRAGDIRIGRVKNVKRK